MKTIHLKILLLAALVLPAQAAIGFWSFPYPCQRRLWLDRLRSEGVTTVHFGDSVQREVAIADRDVRNLHQMLQDALVGERVGAVQADAGPMELYLACAQYLARQDRRPRRLLIPVNLRSFSMEWDPRPEYQARLDCLRLRFGDVLALGFRTPLSLWKIYPLNPISREEYLRLAVVVDGRRVASVGDLMHGSQAAPGKTRLESQFLFRYGYTLSPDHRKLLAMDAIVSTCREAGMEPIFYIYPIDVEAAERAGGAPARDRISRNVETIRRRMADRNARLLDLSRLLKSDAFDWERTRTPNEHLNEQGRRAVVRELEAFLRGR